MPKRPAAHAEAMREQILEGGPPRVHRRRLPGHERPVHRGRGRRQRRADLPLLPQQGRAVPGAVHLRHTRRAGRAGPAPRPHRRPGRTPDRRHRLLLRCAAAGDRRAAGAPGAGRRSCRRADPCGAAPARRRPAGLLGRVRAGRDRPRRAAGRCGRRRDRRRHDDAAGRRAGGGRRAGRCARPGRRIRDRVVRTVVAVSGLHPAAR